MVVTATGGLVTCAGLAWCSPAQLTSQSTVTTLLMGKGPQSFLTGSFVFSPFNCYLALSTAVYKTRSQCHGAPSKAAVSWCLFTHKTIKPYAEIHERNASFLENTLWLWDDTQVLFLQGNVTGDLPESWLLSAESTSAFITGYFSAIVWDETMSTKHNGSRTSNLPTYTDQLQTRDTTGTLCISFSSLKA